MLAISVNLRKQLYFLKVSVWPSFAWLAWSGRCVRQSCKDSQTGRTRPGAINAIASDDAGIGKYRRLYSNVMKAERERQWNFDLSVVRET